MKKNSPGGPLSLSLSNGRTYGNAAAKLERAKEFAASALAAYNGYWAHTRVIQHAESGWREVYQTAGW